MIDICRLCLEEIPQIQNNLVDIESISLNEKIKYVMPEIDVSVTPTLTLCNKCMQSLNICYAFKNKCIQIENVIKEYMQYIETPVLNLKLVRNYKCYEKSNKEIKIKVDEEQLIVDIKNDTADTFSCDKCNEYFHDIKMFKSHCDSCVLYTCIQCAETFLSEEDFENHQKVHVISEHFPCNSCNASFSKDCQLQEHVSKYHPEDVNSVVLNRHIYRHHKKKEKQSSDKFEESHIKNNYDCVECSKSFNSLRYLQQHIKNIHRKTYLCSTCGMKCGRKYALELHIRTHTGEKPYNCDVCGKGFAKKDTLEIHIKCVHGSERPFVCKVCGKSFNLKCTLISHGVIHTENMERTFTCTQCPKKFKTNKCLKQHIRRHTAEKKFICSVCPKSFIDSNGLKKHTRTHTGEQPYECFTCHKRFSQKCNLQIHFRLHKSKTKVGKSIQK